MFWMMLLLTYLNADYCPNPQDKFINFYVVSDSNTKVTGFFEESNAVPYNIVNYIANISEAIWISDKNTGYDSTILTFKVKFAVPGSPTFGNLAIAFDDYLLNVTINGKDTNCKYFSYISGKEIYCDVLSYLSFGINTALFVVQNIGGPAGLIFLLNISVII